MTGSTTTAQRPPWCCLSVVRLLSDSSPAAGRRQPEGSAGTATPADCQIRRRHPTRECGCSLLRAALRARVVEFLDHHVPTVQRLPARAANHLSGSWGRRRLTRLASGACATAYAWRKEASELSAEGAKRAIALEAVGSEAAGLGVVAKFLSNPRSASRTIRRCSSSSCCLAPQVSRWVGGSDAANGCVDSTGVIGTDAYQRCWSGSDSGRNTISTTRSAPRMRQTCLTWPGQVPASSPTSSTGGFDPKLVGSGGRLVLGCCG